MTGAAHGHVRWTTGLLLWASGAALVAAVEHGFWASAAGAVLVGGLSLVGLVGGGRRVEQGANQDGTDDAVALHGLLDQVPTPLVRVDRGASALNRAARALFGTDGAIAPVPSALLDPAAVRLHHAGRAFRLDRVAASAGPTLVALVDVDAERHAAEAHAADDMVEVLGHELLNGLAPVVSLAESARTAADRGDPGLPTLLATLARRADGLQRFVAAYRALARLPAPTPAPVPLGELLDDLRILFAGQPGAPTLVVDAAEGPAAAVLDRDQVTQALWALLRNGVEASAQAGCGGPVRLRVRQGDGRLVFDVVDGGAGVAVPERARIFRPFHTTKPDGSGVGLSLARRVARGHGGDVVLLDTPPTTFRLTLPIHRADGGGMSSVATAP